jgi:hypothetical protein
MYRTNPESWLHQDSKMVPCAQCTHNPMMLWLRVALIEYNEYGRPTRAPTKLQDKIFRKWLEYMYRPQTLYTFLNRIVVTVRMSYRTRGVLHAKKE